MVLAPGRLGKHSTLANASYYTQLESGINIDASIW
jgi:hypothetical protein